MNNTITCTEFKSVSEVRDCDLLVAPVVGPVVPTLKNPGKKEFMQFMNTVDLPISMRNNLFRFYCESEKYFAQSLWTSTSDLYGAITKLVESLMTSLGLGETASSIARIFSCTLEESLCSEIGAIDNDHCSLVLSVTMLLLLGFILFNPMDLSTPCRIAALGCFYYVVYNWAPYFSKGTSILKEWFDTFLCVFKTRVLGRSNTDQRYSVDLLWEAQVDGQDITFYIETLLVLVLTFTGVGRGDASLASGVRELSRIGTSIRGVKGYVEWFVMLMERIFEYVKRYYLPTDFTNPFSNDTKEIRKAKEQIYNLSKGFSDGSVLRSPATLDEILSLDLQCNRLLEIASKKYRDRVMENQLIELLRELKKMREMLESSGLFANSIRQKPVMVLFSGPPGVGKTASMRPLAAALMAHVLPKEKHEKFLAEPDAFMYARNPATKFFDGYNFQEIFFNDEMCQNQPAFVEAENEISSAIGMGTSFPYLLHMAEILAKGNVYFRSKLFIGTTNEKDLFSYAGAFIRCPEALERRFDLHIRVNFKPEYCTNPKADEWARRPDKSKIPSEWDPNIMEFYEMYRPLGQEFAVRRILSFDDLVKRVVFLYRQYDASAQTEIEVSRRVFKRYAEKGYEAQIGDVAQDVGYVFVFLSTTLCVSLAFFGYVVYSAVEALPSPIRNAIVARFQRSVPILGKTKSALTQLYERFGRIEKVCMCGAAALVAGVGLWYKFRPVPTATCLESQGLPINNAVRNVSTKMLMRNIYNVHSGVSVYGFGIFLGKDLLVMPAHFLAEMNDSTVLYLEPLDSMNKSKYSFSKKDVVYLDDDKDLCLVKVPASHNHPDITKFILHEESVPESGHCAMFYPREDCRIGERVSAFHCRASEPYTDPKGKVRSPGRVIHYNLGTTRGECGLPVFCLSNSVGPRVLMGFHVAGSRVSGAGMSVFLSKALAYEPQAEYVHNKVLRKISVFPARVYKTQLKKSPLYGQWGKPIMRPARLGDFWDPNTNERVDPMDMAQRKYDVERANVNQQDANEAVDAVFYDLVNHSAFELYNLRMLTFTETYAGVSGDPYIEPMPLDTSAGYPWNLPNQPYNKRDYFDNSSGTTRLTALGQSFIAELKLKEKSMSERSVEFIFTDCLKDEKRPIEKVLEGKTRMFSGSPMDFYLLFRRYFGCFAAEMARSSYSNEFALGINPYSQDWHALAKYLLAMNGEGGAGDFSGFDTKQPATILKAIGAKICRLYGYEGDTLRRALVLWESIVYSKHVIGDVIIEWNGSNPSGNPLTTQINCLVCAAYFRLAFKSLAKKNMMFFQRFVRIKICGDDHVYTTHDSIKEVFNENTLAEWFSSIGIVYTNEQKETGICASPHRPLSDIEFLKRGFMWDVKKLRFVAPLRMSTILEIPYWSKNNDQFSDIAKKNVDICLAELSIHGKHVWNKHGPKIVQCSRTILQYEPLSDNYETWSNIVDTWGSINTVSNMHGAPCKLIQEPTKIGLLVPKLDSSNWLLEGEMPIVIGPEGKQRISKIRFPNEWEDELLESTLYEAQCGGDACSLSSTPNCNMLCLNLCLYYEWLVLNLIIVFLFTVLLAIQREFALCSVTVSMLAWIITLLFALSVGGIGDLSECTLMYPVLLREFWSLVDRSCSHTASYFAGSL